MYTALAKFFVDLNSFPTRRSSDLGRPESRRSSDRGGSACCSACTGARAASIPTASSTSSAATASRTSSPHRRRRSEEHTSELQSRPHLVFRLLLEKKMRKYYM